MAKVDEGTTTTGALAGDGPGTPAANQHRAADEIARTAQAEDLARARANAGTGDTLGATADYAKRHDIPPDDHPSRAMEGKPGVEREDSEKARKALLDKHGPGKDMNAPDPAAEKLAKDAAAAQKAREDAEAKAAKEKK